MNDELLNALDVSLAALTAGESVEACLARYPALADDLRPLLMAALAAHQLSAEVTVPRLRQNASRAQFLARAAELRSPAPRRAGWTALKLTSRMFVSVFGVLLAVVLGAYGLATVSAPSLPGEALYGVKRAVEQTQLAFTLDPQARDQLQEQLAARRLAETREVLAMGRVAEVRFEGLIDEVMGERWSVAGLTVIVPAEASITGVPVAGLFVEVVGQTQPNGIVRATTAHITGLIFRGIVNTLGPTTWQVNERSVVINAQTQFVGAIGLGDEVDVIARQQEAGLLLALRMTLVEQSATPTATLTALPTSTVLPPSTTPTPITLTPSASPTRPPNGTPTRTPTRTPTDEAEEIEFSGIVESINTTVWQIGGQTVLITADTDIRDNAGIGDRVKVRALRDANDTLTATRIELDNSGPSNPTNTPGSGGGASPTPATSTPVSTGTPAPTNTPDETETDEPGETEFEGTVTAINGEVWTIGGQQVTVNGATEYEGNPGVGSYVDVNAWVYPGGVLIARRIRVR